MTPEHLDALLRLADLGPAGDDGFSTSSTGSLLALHVAANGVSLTVSRVEGLKVEGELITARTARGEVYVINRTDIFAGAVEGVQEKGRKAGFV